MDQITRPIERPIASTTEQALHTFPPFSGELKVDENLKYERRQPNQLEKYIRVFLPDQQSKTATLNKVARYPNPYELATLASTAYQEESGTYQEENEKSLPKRWELLI
ncbi:MULTISPECIES: hypothetical protein, partial [unclassified Candidatus Cardinium]|uniref:hypothetical protein n=1 Tax=unclassified Candidatus Cardinium TaxID=2641185 RepID=UPI001FB3507A